MSKGARKFTRVFGYGAGSAASILAFWGVTTAFNALWRVYWAAALVLVPIVLAVFAVLLWCLDELHTVLSPGSRG